MLSWQTDHVEIAHFFTPYLDFLTFFPFNFPLTREGFISSLQEKRNEV